MDAVRSRSRRRLLGSIGGVVSVAGLGGCLDDSGENDPDESDAGGDDPDESDADGDDPDENDQDGDDPETDELDLREANVVDVAFESEGGTYTFDVMLHHDDEGEDGYANWWQVERVDGTRLGRRNLAHAHSQQPFTRSETVEIPDDVNCVVVRGHDQTHEYGGVAAVIDLDSAELRPIEQGSEKRSVDADDCPQ
ncbi:hypothetical protein ACFQH2_04720 [Natronoarchaeum sp. GCM10025703]|uniref:hypothetical protein n=1 Tax=unclassified Natronoarchaeum TaxID=2620183 RepID=UPI00360C16A6